MILEWAEPAEADLGKIYDFIARDAPYYAERFLDRLIAAVETLADYPRIGRQVPEAEREDVRELIFHSYRVIYLIKPDRITIVAIVHGSRDLSRLETQPWDVV